MTDDDDDLVRSLAARRENEALMLSATLLNNLAVGVFVAGLIAPNAAGRSLPPLWYVALTAVAIALHFAGRLLLHGLKSEH